MTKALTIANGYAEFSSVLKARIKKPKKKRTRHSSFYRPIADLARTTQRLACRAARKYASIVETIICSECQDIRHIERTLDGLLDFCFDPNVLLIYKKLCRYYYDIDATITASYVHAYRELWDSEPKGTIKQVGELKAAHYVLPEGK